MALARVDTSKGAELCSSMTGLEGVMRHEPLLRRLRCGFGVVPLPPPLPSPPPPLGNPTQPTHPTSPSSSTCNFFTSQWFSYFLRLYCFALPPSCENPPSQGLTLTAVAPVTLCCHSPPMLLHTPLLSPRRGCMECHCIGMHLCHGGSKDCVGVPCK